MISSRNTSLNNIPTDDQNYFCEHWSQSQRVLEILGQIVDDPALQAEIERVMAYGEDIDSLLQKGQPSKRRALYQKNSTGWHRGAR